jgi:hypothetical protein
MPPNGGFLDRALGSKLSPQPCVDFVIQDNRTSALAQLEESYPLYCKALRILVREQKTIRQVQRSVCWHRLEQLHQCLPRQYKDPNHLYLHLKREISP